VQGRRSTTATAHILWELTCSSAAVLSDTVIVRVGAEAKKYTLHKRLLAHHSEYFRGALSGNFRETDDGVVLLDDVMAEVFDIFVDWLYEKRLPDCFGTPGVYKDRVSIKYHAYVLADRLVVPGMKKEIMDRLFVILATPRNYPAYGVITFAFRNLPEKDPLLQLLVDSFCVNDGISLYPATHAPSKQIMEVPHEAFVRLFQKMHAISGLCEDEKEMVREVYKV
jgi:hypothetical protein